MVKINDRFYITADSMSYRVMEKTINKDESSKNFGKETESIVGYNTTIEQCIQGILKLLSDIMFDLQVCELENLNKREYIEDIIKTLKSLLGE